MRFLLLLPRRHHLPTADVPAADPGLQRGAHQGLLLPEVRVPRQDGHHERHASGEIISSILDGSYLAHEHEYQVSHPLVG